MPMVNPRISHLWPLYRYYLSQGGFYDHFYTLNAASMGTTTVGEIGKYGYKFEGISGYCFSTATPRNIPSGTVPLFRYYSGSGKDHFYTTNSKEIGSTVPWAVEHNYYLEEIVCYVFP